jgi:hypothetical protein
MACGLQAPWRCIRLERILINPREIHESIEPQPLTPIYLASKGMCAKTCLHLSEFLVWRPLNHPTLLRVESRCNM